MFLQTKAEKLNMLESLIERTVIEYDKKSNCYYIGVPSNFIIHSSGTIIIKGGESVVIDATQLHFNPPRNFFENISQKIKKLIKV